MTIFNNLSIRLLLNCWRNTRYRLRTIFNIVYAIICQSWTPRMRNTIINIWKRTKPIKWPVSAKVISCFNFSNFSLFNFPLNLIPWLILYSITLLNCTFPLKKPDNLAELHLTNALWLRLTAMQFWVLLKRSPNETSCFSSWFRHSNLKID